MKIGIKRLTKSDLSLFAPHLDAAKQKAINLNASVFIESMYPGLSGTTTPIPFALEIFGPAGAQPIKLQRKAIRSPGSKNWRLNGEIISNPPSDSTRFDDLSPGDYSVLAFWGQATPKHVQMFLIGAQTNPDLHERIGEQFAFNERKTMVGVSAHDFTDFIAGAEADQINLAGLSDLEGNDSIEDVIYQGGHSDGLNGTISPTMMSNLMEGARETGEQGEERFSVLLENESIEFTWVSITHARASYDFLVKDPPWAKGDTTYVDVKSTKGPQERHFHVSLAELRWASQHPNYFIARVSNLSHPGSKVVVYSRLPELASQILSVFEGLSGLGTAVDSVKIDPNQLEPIWEQSLPDFSD